MSPQWEAHREPQEPTWPQPQHRGRLRNGLTIGALIVGWLLLLAATAQPLLAAIQVGMLGLGAIGTAIVIAVWPNQRGQS